MPQTSRQTHAPEARGSSPRSRSAWGRQRAQAPRGAHALWNRPQEHRPDTARGFRHERVGPDNCPYLERWVLNLGPVAVRLHHFFRSDEDHLHDHPWWFAGVILRGHYSNVTDVGTEEMRPGRIYFRPALHRHRVVTTGCWTLLLTGEKVRDWGFWVDGAWMRQRKYFRKHPSHACED